mmetsp:Transcript_23452/g.54660  ORF Transcript_23452/g.54660 Transcript_23452/m.54660 type:complete len:307 (-) Transcript_23452:664-1584(-)
MLPSSSWQVHSVKRRHATALHSASPSGTQLQPSPRKSKQVEPADAASVTRSSATTVAVVQSRSTSSPLLASLLERSWLRCSAPCQPSLASGGRREPAASTPSWRPLWPRQPLRLRSCPVAGNPCFLASRHGNLMWQRLAAAGILSDQCCGNGCAGGEVVRSYLVVDSTLPLASSSHSCSKNAIFCQRSPLQTPPPGRACHQDYPAPVLQHCSAMHHLHCRGQHQEPNLASSETHLPESSGTSESGDRPRTNPCRQAAVVATRGNLQTLPQALILWPMLLCDVAPLGYEVALGCCFAVVWRSCHQHA